MNTILSTIAAVVIVVLIAALVGPTFVDWNGFRGEIERQASRLTGRDVKIGGDIDFVMLPSPHITVADISISNSLGTENTELARIEKVDAKLALAPLLRGEIAVTSVRIMRPQVHLEVMAGGESNWGSVLANLNLPEKGLFSLSSIRLDRANIEEGTLTFSNHVTMRNWRLNRISGDIMADSLAGPARSQLAFETNGVPLAMQFSMGRAQDNKAFPVTFKLENRNAETKFEFSGVTTGLAFNSRIEGRANLHTSLGQGTVTAGKKPPLRMEAAVLADGGKAEFKNLVLAMEGTSLKGTAVADWTGRPRMEVRLKGDALMLDPALDAFPVSTGSGKVPLSNLASMPLPEWMDGKIDVLVDGLLIRKALVKNAALSASLRDGSLEIKTLKGEFAGGTGFALKGALATGENGRSFDGEINATSSNLAALRRLIASWRADPKSQNEQAQSNTAAGLNKPFAVSSHVRLLPDRLEFSGIEAAYALSPQPAELSGSFSIALREDEQKRPLATLALAIKSFDADPLLALFSAGGATQVELLAAYDSELNVTADKLHLMEREAKELTLTATLSQDKLVLQRLDAADFSGARIALAGDVEGVGKESFDRWAGNLRGTLETDDASQIAALAGFESASFAGPAKLAMETSKAAGENGRIDSMSLKGDFAGSAIDAHIKRNVAADGVETNIEMNGSASNANGPTLLAQLGLNTNRETGAELAVAPASASLKLSGEAGKPYDVEAKIDAQDFDMTAKGTLADPWTAATFTGKAQMSATDTRNALLVFGASLPVAEFAAAQAAGPSFVLSSEIVAGKYLLELKNFEMVAGGLHAQGSVTYTDAVEDGLPQLDGKVTANRLDLAPLFVSEDGALPTASLDWSALSRFEGNLALSADNLQLGYLHLEKASIPLAVKEGALTASPVKGMLAKGDATLNASFASASGEHALSLTGQVENADMTRLGSQLFNAKFASGEVDADFSMEGKGRSWFALVASLSGSGKVETEGAEFTGLDVQGFAAGLKEIKSFEQFTPLQNKALASGSTPVENFEGELKIEDGVVSIGHETLVLAGNAGKLEADYDLARREGDAELGITLAEPKGAPDFKVTANVKSETVKRHVDVAALSQFMSARIIKQKARDAGVASLPKELDVLISGGGASSAASAGQDATIAGIPMPAERPSLTRPGLQ